MILNLTFSGTQEMGSLGRVGSLGSLGRVGRWAGFYRATRKAKGKRQKAKGKRQKFTITAFQLVSMS
ncbi:MAG: hypothetical protein F6J90_23815 [Moorea sp. SIOASIH]|uniref:hypothetical protein n=1 Tax=Moorena sp. SIOASIH TaxID=2607817 RepID=UPI0013BC2C94|nr:hypothetical protein [Moorena sp. SIOASIH]NEO39195.1 hypothetical protein [Moorena sp. SIOASIH]